METTKTYDLIQRVTAQARALGAAVEVVFLSELDIDEEEETHNQIKEVAARFSRGVTEIHDEYE